MTIPGINIYGATALFIKIGNIDRFAFSDKLSAYFGVVASTHESDKKKRQGRITKSGCDIIRTILVNASPYAIEGSEELKNFYNRILPQRGKQIAKVAFARKLATIIWAMLSKNQTFNKVNEESLKRKIKLFVNSSVRGTNVNELPGKRATTSRRQYQTL